MLRRTIRPSVPGPAYRSRLKNKPRWKPVSWAASIGAWVIVVRWNGLEIRQHSAVHERALAELRNGAEQSTLTGEVLATFEAMAWVQERFGTVAYEVMLTDSLWGVYQMIGKLNPRIYVLSA